MKIGSVKSGYQQNFGRKIIRTKGLGNLLQEWRIKGFSQEKIEDKLGRIKNILPDNFEFSVNTVKRGKGNKVVDYSLIFKDGTKTDKTAPNITPYAIIKSIKKNLAQFKEALIKEKGKKAVTGKGF